MNGDMVEKIVADKHDHLWILSNQRLTEFDPATSVYSPPSATQICFSLSFLIAMCFCSCFPSGCDKV